MSSFWTMKLTGFGTVTSRTWLTGTPMFDDTRTDQVDSFLSADGGARVIVLYHSSAFRVFGQAMFGVTHRGVDAVSDNGLSGGSSLSHFTWEPGGGIDVSISQRIAVRFEGSDRLTPLSNQLPPRYAISEPSFVSSFVLKP